MNAESLLQIQRGFYEEMINYFTWNLSVSEFSSTMPQFPSLCSKNSHLFSHLRSSCAFCILHWSRWLMMEYVQVTPIVYISLSKYVLHEHLLCARCCTKHRNSGIGMTFDFCPRSTTDEWEDIWMNILVSLVWPCHLLRMASHHLLQGCSFTL